MKRLIGEYIIATRRENMLKETEAKFILYNAILKFDTTTEIP